MDPLALRSLIESTTSCTVDSYMKTYSGIATFFRTKYDPGFSTTDIALVGLPIDAGLTQRTGARHGPREVRNQSCNVLYFNPLTKVNPLALCRVTDIGDVPMAAAFDLETIIDEIRNFYTKLHAAKVVPLTVGGDHSISFPILQALGSARPVGLIHMTPISIRRADSGSTLHHGSPFFNAVGRRARSKRTVHIGIRDPYAELEPFAVESGMTIIDINRFHDLGIASRIEVTRILSVPVPPTSPSTLTGSIPRSRPAPERLWWEGSPPTEGERCCPGFRGLDIVGGDVIRGIPAI